MKIPSISTQIEQTLNTVANNFIYKSNAEQTLLQQWIVSRVANSTFLVLRHTVSMTVLQPFKLVEHSTNIALNTTIILTPVIIMRSFRLLDVQVNDKTIDQIALEDLVSEISETVKVLFDVVFNTARTIRDTLEVILLNTEIEDSGQLNRRHRTAAK